MTGYQALFSLSQGRKLRCRRWQRGCYIQINIDAETKSWAIIAHGSDKFRAMVARELGDSKLFKNLLLDDWDLPDSTAEGNT